MGWATFVVSVIAWIYGGWWWVIAFGFWMVFINQLTEQSKKEEPKKQINENELRTERLQTPPTTSPQQAHLPNDTWIGKLTALCHDLSDVDIFVGDAIPEGSLAIARQAFPLPVGGKEVALIGSSSLSNTHHGILIGENGLSWGNLSAEPKPGSMLWGDFSAKSLSLDGTRISIGTEGVFDTPEPSISGFRIFQLLERIQRSYQIYQHEFGVKPAPRKYAMKREGPVNVNAAKFDALVSLPGIRLAEANIVLTRRASGKYLVSIDEMADVLDLKPEVVERLRGEVTFTEAPSPIAAPRSSETDSSSSISRPVEVNAATFDALISLPGIGAAEAKIVLARRACGQYLRSIDELSDLLQLKPHIVERLRGQVKFAKFPSTIAGPRDAEPAPSASRFPMGGRTID